MLIANGLDLLYQTIWDFAKVTKPTIVQLDYPEKHRRFTKVAASELNTSSLNNGARAGFDTRINGL